MPGRLPSGGFFAAVVLAALALVGGGMPLFMELQDHTNHVAVPSAIFAVGAALLIIAFITRATRQRFYLILRNGLMVLFVVGIALVLLRALRGPGH